MNQSQPINVNDLFQSAHEDGLLSTASMDALDVTDIGTQIQAGLGIDVDDVTASEVVLVTIMPDDSGSIRFSGNAQAVRGGHNSVLDALAASFQQDNILIHNRYLNGSCIVSLLPLRPSGADEPPKLRSQSRYTSVRPNPCATGYCFS